MTNLEFITEVNDDFMISVYTDKPEDSTEDMQNAIADMAAEYNNLKFIGYKDGHHFCITEVINLDTNRSLSEDAVLYMYYIAHGPECITIRMNEEDYFDYLTQN